MKALNSILCLTFLLSKIGSASSDACAQSQPAKISTEGLQCSSFQWASDENSPKAVIRVPITINGKQYRYQLDTGADVVIAYGKAVHKGWEERSDFSKVHHIEFGGASISVLPIYRMRGTSDKNLQGTVGLDLLVGHTFVIDFPKRRVCLLNRGELPDIFDRAASWTPAEVRDGKLFLKRLVLNGKPIDNVIYDSGSSPDELALDMPLWSDATGKQSPDDATSHVFAQTWGEKVEYIGAKATGSLLIGNHSYPNPILSACPSRPHNFRDAVHGATGALGNALFFDSIVILDLGSHPQFGVIPLPRMSAANPQ